MKQSDTERAAATKRAVDMLRAGATTRSIRAATGVREPEIAQLRRDHGIPVPEEHRQHRLVAVDDAYHGYIRPAPGGHVIWTKPSCNSTFEFQASGRRYNARHMAFEQHHGRPPEGRLSRLDECTVAKCIAGAHHADQRIRDGNAPERGCGEQPS